MKIPLTTIRTGSVTLAPIDASYQSALADILQDVRIQETYMVPDYQTAAEYEALAEKIIEMSHDEEHFVRGIYAGDELAGLINDCGIENGEIELGYVIAPEHWNKGFASDALQGAISVLLDRDSAIHTVVCGAFEDNEASLRVMEKAGMQAIEKTEMIEYRGRNHNCRYTMIRTR